MKLKDVKFTRKNRKNINGDNKRMLANANFLNDGKTFNDREELKSSILWRKKNRENIDEWRTKQKLVEMGHKR